MPQRRPRVLLADDHPMMLDGLRKLLEPDFEVVAAVMDGRELLESAQRLRPDLIITDISMPGIDGLEATRRLLAAVPGARVLILSIHADPSWVREAFEAGACGYLTKISAPEEIGTAIREVLKGLFYVSPIVTRGVVDAAKEYAARHPETALPRSIALPALSAVDELLTPRELATVRLVGQGLSNKAIAQHLGVSVTTVRTHLNKAYDKLGSASRVELALLAAPPGGAMM
ncbi:MAG TPA: response regulator transcription factor [Thermoanaerobaculia bacterium]|nr:response regulator transcription factor [Thermoanaerobaculia bacterium]